MEAENKTMYDMEKVKALEEFSKIESNAAKMDFVYSKISKIDIIATLHRTPKSNDQAKIFRLQGNKYFLTRWLSKALIMYNQSICFAEANSEALGLGYGNRSAVYFELKKYELCLSNIELAIVNGYPQRLMHKLNKRKNECGVALQIIRLACNDNNDDDPLVPVLSFPSHPNVPSIGNCLKLHENAEFGRHIVTKVDLSVGQVVAIEDSFCTILDPKFKYQRCTNCLRENNLNLIPCKSCTTTMFCCQNCAVEAEKNFHRIECPIIDLISVHFAKESFIHKAIRATIVALNSFNDIDAFRSFLEDPNSNRNTVFDLNCHSDTPLREQYKAIHGLQTYEGKLTESELFECAGVASIFYNNLIKSTPLLELIKTEDDQKVLKELVFRFMQLFPICAIRFDELMGLMPSQSKDSSSYGHGLFAFHGLLNHSCEPNCLTVCFNGRSNLFVRRPIKAGEQLFISYGMDHVTHSVTDRQRELLSNFKFKCQCKACKSGDYYDNMGSVPKDSVPSMLTWIDAAFIMNPHSKKYILNNLQRYINYINKFDHHYPCRQLCAADGCLLSCLHVLYTETAFAPPMN